MPYLYAFYQPPSLIDLPDAPKQIGAVDSEGQQWAFREDSEVGDWLRYLEDGGTIAESKEAAEAEYLAKTQP
jgi:hypothetical protein